MGRFKYILPGPIVGIAILLLGAAVSAQVRVGEIGDVSIETPHPYPDGTTDRPVVWTYTLSHPGATFMKVHFATFAVKGKVKKRSVRGDYVSIKDGEGTEREILSGVVNEDLWARSVPGDTVTIELHADATENSFGLFIDRYGFGTAPLYPQKGSILPHPYSVCGGDDKEPICEASVAERIRLSEPVGRLFFANDCGGFWLCTGFLFTADGQLMTNAHCANSKKESKSMEVWFNYVEDNTASGPCSLPGRPNPDIFRAQKFIQMDCDLDMAVHLIYDPVKGNPADIYGYLPLSSQEPVVEEAVWIPQHPLGMWKKIAEINAAVSTPLLEGINFCRDPPHGCFVWWGALTGKFTEFGYTADTDGGSSGSPILDENHRVIGLHHAAGCNGKKGENSGILMRFILPATGKAPKARFRTDPRKRRGKVPFTLIFDGSRSIDPDGGGIVEYRWDFGDGSPLVEGPQATVSHTYASAGIFKATLRVIDDEGTESKRAARKKVRVKN